MIHKPAPFAGPLLRLERFAASIARSIFRLARSTASIARSIFGFARSSGAPVAGALVSALFAFALLPGGVSGLIRAEGSSGGTNPPLPGKPGSDPTLKADAPADASADASTATVIPNPSFEVVALAQEALKSYSDFFPAKTYALGILDIDSTLAVFQKSAITSFVSDQKGYLSRLEKIKADSLTDEARVERDALRAHLRTTIWNLETAAVPAHDPDFYIDESVGAIQRLLDREEMSPLTRATFLRNRLLRFGIMFDAARSNLESCSRVDILHALTRLRSARQLFAESLPVELHRGGTLSGIRGGQETVAAWKACTDFADWLKKERLPQARPSAPLGEKAWRNWMAVREDTSVDPAAVVAAASADMARLKDELKIAAAAVAKGKSPAEIIADMSTERLGYDIVATRGEKSIGELYRWMRNNKPVELPSEEPVFVRQTPPFRRREAPARGDFPGAFMQVSEDSYLEVAAPDPDWPEPILYAWMAAYARPFLPLAVMREIYPGRHTLWLFMKATPIRTCKFGFFPTMDEGWGLYAEELAVRLGFGSDDPKLKVGMLADMIRADARVSASVRLHTMGIPPAEVAAWLASEAYWPKLVAMDETAKLLADPTASDAGFGRLALIALRDDVKKLKGSAFVAQAFHMRLLSYGQAPIAALRRIFLPGSAAPLVGPSK